MGLAHKVRDLTKIGGVYLVVSCCSFEGTNHHGLKNLYSVLVDVWTSVVIFILLVASCAACCCRRSQQQPMQQNIATNRVVAVSTVTTDQNGIVNPV